MHHINGVIYCLSDAIPRLSVAMCRIPTTSNNKYTYMFTVFSEHNDIHYLTIVSLWTLTTTGLSLIQLVPPHPTLHTHGVTSIPVATCTPLDTTNDIGFVTTLEWDTSMGTLVWGHTHMTHPTTTSADLFHTADRLLTHY